MTYGDEILMTISHPVCWTGSAKGNDFPPVNARIWCRFGTAYARFTSRSYSNFNDPSWGTFFSFVHPIRQLKTIQLVLFSILIEPFSVNKVSKSHPRAFSDAPRATRISNFLYVVLRSKWSKSNFLLFTSKTVRVSCGLAPDASILYCKVGNVFVRPPPHLSFSTGTDLSSVEGRPLWRFSEVLTSARCT